ncbi:substrate-binding domain-containing protein [Halobacillus salinarum]|uniref:Substrate-binding domain-containing protein n=1 Tax=Halobacillus salinarum TaxID=2932257 RepID=A0ABY4ELI8_9BACI|nr:substrate-binding domain-containing protein [Halobacillus salinarum]UOQ44983.1 substrate-binding domain-containing protein [Halobacillus salinarum]
MERVTMADVAKEAGVSKSTVSQFLNKRYEYMGEETRRKIQQAITELGYQPNYLARSLKQKRTSMIGIIVANIKHRFSTEVSHAIEEYCYDADIQAIVCNADDDPVKEKKYIEMLMAKQVDGLIIFPTGKNIELYDSMIHAKYPVVFMDRKAGDINLPRIVSNNIESAYQAVEHFVKQGHTRISIVTQSLTITPRAERVEGYKRCLEDYQIDWNEDYVINNPISDLQEELEKMFSSNHPPTALLAGNDRVFLELLKFTKRKEMTIPDDFSLIVFDNIQYAAVSTPAVSTISQPAAEMGRKAAELLLKQIQKEPVEAKEHVYPCELVIRET